MLAVLVGVQLQVLALAPGGEAVGQGAVAVAAQEWAPGSSWVVAREAPLAPELVGSSC